MLLLLLSKQGGTCILINFIPFTKMKIIIIIIFNSTNRHGRNETIQLLMIIWRNEILKITMSLVRCTFLGNFKYLLNNGHQLLNKSQPFSFQFYLKHVLFQIKNQAKEIKMPWLKFNNIKPLSELYEHFQKKNTRNLEVYLPSGRNLRVENEH